MGGFWTYYVLLKKMQGHVFKLGEVSISGHLFGRFLIKEALDIIEAAGCSFHLVKWVKDEMCCLQE
ncbi:alpha-aminoadipic semialdehyde synthase [Artemisia annua]|uniref:Alpha-aminoadipic semialdehyde synthase n=1 Tax=Artemisia annua TaxID=35608 RepID=A0A2U1KYA1_ARTAN|nr:alpha-aminoadipic semialdehyde synthase [Artemisia annua]